MTGKPTAVRQLDYDGQEFAFEDPTKVGPRFDLYEKVEGGPWTHQLSDYGESCPAFWAMVAKASGRKIRIVRIDETLVYDSEDPAP